MTDFELVARRHQEITKVALLGSLAMAALKTVGGAIVRNPLKTLGIVGAGADVAHGVKSGVSAAGFKGGIAPTSGPTF